MVLPPLKTHTIARPGKSSFEESFLIPNENEFDFWEEIYRSLRSLKFHSPVVRQIRKYINPLFGFFGFRVHPVTHQTRYFHAGVSLDLKNNRKIYPIASGILEYAGYGAVNGHYVLLSHPDILTEDGYVLHSMYCHLKKPLVRFNSYQKMLREISLGSYPLIPVSSKKILGTAATSGLSRENYPGIYLQLSFRKYNETPIIIDPLRIYQQKKGINISHDITDPREVQKLFEG